MTVATNNKTLHGLTAGLLQNSHLLATEGISGLRCQLVTH